MLDNRTKILNAASDLFLSGGLAVLSVRAIAKQAGVSTIGIYSYFDGKQGILDALYIEGFNRVAEAMDVSGLKLSPNEKVMATVKKYLAVADQYGAHYKLIFGELDGKYQPSDQAKRVAEKAFQKLIDIASLTLADDVSLIDKQRKALEMWAIVHGYISLKNHAFPHIMDDKEWRQMILQTIEKQLNFNTEI